MTIDLNTNARSMSNEWSKKKWPLFLVISIVVGRHMPIHTSKRPTFLQNQMQISHTSENAPLRTFHPMFRNWMKKLFEKAKTHTQLLIFICTVIWKADFPLNGWSELHCDVRPIMKIPGWPSSSSWRETFREARDNHRRKFTGVALTWYSYLDSR